jgi:hypothetical protein
MPVLVMVGDQDTPAWEASLLVHRHAPHCGLAVLPFTGHTLPVEEPEQFNSLVDQFLAAVDSGRWGSWRAAARPCDLVQVLPSIPGRSPFDPNA